MTAADLDAIGSLADWDTQALSNALDALRLRPCHIGYTDGSVRHITGTPSRWPGGRSGTVGGHPDLPAGVHENTMAITERDRTRQSSRPRLPRTLPTLHSRTFRCKVSHSAPISAIPVRSI